MQPHFNHGTYGGFLKIYTIQAHLNHDCHSYEGIFHMSHFNVWYKGNLSSPIIQLHIWDISLLLDKE